MAFTDQEMMVLSQLAYQNDKFHEGMSLEAILNSKAASKELAQLDQKLVESLMKKVIGKEYRLVKNANDTKTGFGAMAIADPDKEVTVVCRGTDGFSLNSESRKDVLHGDAGLIFGSGSTRQHDSMKEFMQELEKKNYKSYSFTGHSLGGNLAMFGAICIAKAGKVKRVVPFNAPQFNAAFCKLHWKDIKRIADVTVQYQTKGDIVSSINGTFTMGEVRICASTHQDAIDHSLSSFKLSDYNFVREGTKTFPPLSLDNFTMWVFFPLVLPILTTWQTGKAYSSYKNSINSVSSRIIIQTEQMRTYADQLAALSKRAKQLDEKMNVLYISAGIDWNTVRAVRNLGAVLSANLMVKQATHLDLCVRYLNKTAEYFDEVENDLKNIN